jgi:hypothetical protein
MTLHRHPSLGPAQQEVKLVHVVSDVHNNVRSTGNEVDADLKNQALEEVLQSLTFCRAEQLRKFLRYICKLEIEGKAGDISEHSIGVEALGRPADFITSEDGIVRNRAHALRQKLFEYYAKENPGAPVYIELPKGSYVPRFYPASAEEPGERQYPAPAASRLRDFILGAIGASLLGYAAVTILGSAAPQRQVHPVIRDAWGSLIVSDADDMLVISMPSHFLLRPFAEGATLPDEWMNLQPAPEAVEWYKSRGVLRRGDALILRPSLSLRAGEVQALLTAIKVLNTADAGYQVVAEGVASLTLMRGRNVILAGDPQLSPSVAQYLEGGAFEITFDPSFKNFVIRERTQANLVISQTSSADWRNENEVGEYPGLLSILPSEPAGSRKRTVVFACANSAGCHGAAEFFSSPDHMSELRRKFQQEGVDGFPRSYQVVVRARAESQWLLSVSYVAHRILDSVVH